MKTGVKQTPETTMVNAQHKYSAEMIKLTPTYGLQIICSLVASF